MIDLVCGAARPTASLAVLQRVRLLPSAHPARHGVLVAVQLLRDVAARPPHAMERDNRCTLDERQLVDAAVRTPEQRRRRRGRGRGGGGCSCRGWVAARVVMLCAQVMALCCACHSGPRAAGLMAALLGTPPTRTHNTAGTSTAARERGPSSAASARGAHTGHALLTAAAWCERLAGACMASQSLSHLQQQQSSSSERR